VRHPPAKPCGLVAAALILLFVTPPATSETEPKGKSSLADVLASLSLPDLDGKKVELDTLLGSGPVILDFWATWCKPCLMAMPELISRLSAAPLVLIGSGGILYTIGAVVYALRRPDPWPRVFGFHEVFHALVIAAAALHFVAMAGWIIPAG